MPKVSVIIPCWNSAHYVGDAIESALQQTYGNLEVIVIDDGSTDSSLEIIRSFKDRIRWESGPNRGACAARNRGLCLARGEYVQFLDADDAIYPQKIERHLAAIDSADSDIVFSHGETIPASHPNCKLYQRPYYGGDSVIYLLGGVLPTPAPLHRIEHLRRIGGFREDLPCSQERDLHLRLACEGFSFRQIPEILFGVRCRAESISADSLKVIDQHYSIFSGAYQVLLDRGALTEERAMAFSEAIGRDARIYVKNGSINQAERYLSLANRMHAGGVSRTFRGKAQLLFRLFGPIRAEQLVAKWQKLKT